MSIGQHPPQEFATTRWTMILAAGGNDAAVAKAALETLCSTYWYPLYAFVRRQGHDAQSAQDLTQEFFAQLLARRDLQTVDPARGRFRSFLLAAAKNFLRNDWDRRHAAKRGGKMEVLSLDYDDAERRYSLEPATSQTPERLYERQWALALLDRVRSGLASEAEAAGKLELFQRLSVYLTSETNTPRYADAAGNLGMSEAAVKVAVHRLRRKFRDRLRQEIAHTVAAPEDVDDEIRDLFEALRS